jgi:DNA-binding PadR family transcriptional regulator
MKKGVHDYIINTLQEGSLTTEELVLRTSSACNVSAQAIYKTLTNLRKNEVVTISNHTLSLSLLYIEKEKDTWHLAYRIASSGKELSQALKRDKQKIVYSFNTFHELDLFWTHSFTILSANVPISIPRYMITPHDFFFYARPETDTFWIKKNATNQHISRLLVPYALPLDKEVIKVRRNTSGTEFEFLVGENPLRQKEYIYYNILGDYIFTGTMDKKIHIAVVDFIATHSHIPRSTKDLAVIENILSTKGRFTLTIERNKKKAESMENKVRKYFE